MADRAAPGRQEARHARRYRAVHDLGEGEHDRCTRARPAGRPLASVGVLRARRTPALRARRARARVARDGALRRGVAFMYTIVLPRALDFLTSYDDQPLRHPDPRELLLHVRGDDPARRRPRVPDADLRPRTRASSRPDLRSLRKNRRIAYVAAARLRDPAADGRPGLSRVRGHPARSSSSRCRSGSPSSWNAAGTATGTRSSPKPSLS